MEYVENFFIWAAEQFAIAYRRIGIQVIPRWNSLAYSYHMLLMLGSFFVMVLGVGLLFVHDPYWKRHPDKQYVWVKKDDGTWIGYYKIFIKAFYYPMLVYMFQLISPFTSISLLEPTETFFLRFRELQRTHQLVQAMLLILSLSLTIIGGITNGMQQDHQDFLDWVKKKYFFSYLLFFWD